MWEVRAVSQTSVSDDVLDGGDGGLESGLGALRR